MAVNFNHPQKCSAWSSLVGPKVRWKKFRETSARIRMEPPVIGRANDARAYSISWVAVKERKLSCNDMGK